jgi:hypothetical protein
VAQAGSAPRCGPNALLLLTITAACRDESRWRHSGRLSSSTSDAGQGRGSGGESRCATCWGFFAAVYLSVLHPFCQLNARVPIEVQLK